MAFSLPLHIKVLVILMDPIWFSVFPLILFSIGRSTGLKLMGFIGSFGLFLVYVLMFRHLVSFTLRKAP